MAVAQSSRFREYMFYLIIETAGSGTNFFLKLFKSLPWPSRNASHCVRAMRQTKMVRMCTYACSTCKLSLLVYVHLDLIDVVVICCLMI